MLSGCSRAVFTQVSLVLCWHIQYYKSCHKITVVFLSGIAKLAFGDKNVGFNLGFFPNNKPQQAQGNEKLKVTSVTQTASQPNGKNSRSLSIMR